MNESCFRSPADSPHISRFPTNYCLATPPTVKEMAPTVPRSGNIDVPPPPPEQTGPHGMALPTSPTWIPARWFNDLSHLAQHGFPSARHLLDLALSLPVQHAKHRLGQGSIIVLCSRVSHGGASVFVPPRHMEVRLA